MDVRLITNSDISDLEFFDSLARGHVFGQRGIVALVQWGMLTWPELLTPESSGGDAANPSRNISHTVEGDSVAVHMEDGGVMALERPAYLNLRRLGKYLFQIIGLL